VQSDPYSFQRKNSPAFLLCAESALPDCHERQRWVETVGQVCSLNRTRAVIGELGPTD
jgi:hypothetical protein